jgi:hypothetical protein
VYRTAKRLFEGKVYYTDKGEDGGDKLERYGRERNSSLGNAFVLESRGQSN